jgi:phosphoribosylformylglycinamidine (FGAM) synthase-like enzyme
MGYPNNIGFDVATDSELRKDAFLFGEVQSRIVVSVTEQNKEEFIEFMSESNTPFSLLGETINKDIKIDNENWGPLSEFAETFNDSLGNHLNN